MAFDQATKDAALKRAAGQCECRRISCPEHPNSYRCPTKLVKGHYEFHHVTAVSSGGSDALSNCEVLCTPCHQQTQSYGAH
jgi:5-methylcytosine-specific restriction endonuclease McrA